MKYRRIVHDVDAFKFEGQGPVEWPQWARDTLDLRFEITNVQCLTKHGSARANIGDWIIRTPAGEVYPCTDEVFKKNYAPVP